MDFEGARRREEQLLRISKSPVIDDGDLPATYRLVTSAAATALGIARASVWRWDQHRDAIVCQLLHDGGAEHDEPVALRRDDYPRYFAALDDGRAILAHDAHTDPRTSEFSTGYLRPLGIASMLDVTIRHHGEMVGVLCCEAIGEPREWEEHEASFAAALADLIGRATTAQQRVAADTALRELNATLDARFRHIADAVDVIFWIAAPDLSAFHYVNPAIERRLGWTAAELMDDAGLFFQAVEEPDLPHVLDRLAEVGRGAEGEAEFRVRARDGEEHWLWARAFPDLDEHGRVVQIIGTATDITDRKRLEAELQLRELEAKGANDAKSAFLATMTHEIRTPMIGVTGMLEVLSHTTLDAEQRRALAVIRQSADALLQVLGDVLDLSKIEAGRLDLEPVVVDVRALVDLVVDNFDHPASSRGLMLTATIDDRLAPAHRTDPIRLRQILTNLVSNALKFTPAGRVEVTLRVLDDDGTSQQLELAVHDTGIGISPEDQARLFARFTQAESSTTRRFGGTGLGLHICRLLAELMGGSVELESEEGRGTTVRVAVALPTADPALLPIQDTQGGPTATTGRAPRTREEALAEGSLVLLVEDHPTNRLVVSRQLELAGFACDVAEDGAEGLARWRQGGHAIVLTDLHMPELDGIDLVRAIRRDESILARPRTPVLALTAAGLRDEHEQCLEAGMDDVIVKPASVATLGTALRRWLPHLDWSSPPPVLGGTTPAGGDDVETVIAAFQQLLGCAHADALELTERFRTTAGVDLDQLAAAVGARDAVAVADVAHRLKGSLRTVGLDAVVDLTEQVEAAVRDDDWIALTQHVGQLSAALRPILDRLDGIS